MCLRNIWDGKVKSYQFGVMIRAFFSILFLRWFIEWTLGIWEKQFFSPRPLCVLGTESRFFQKDIDPPSWKTPQWSRVHSLMQPDGWGSTVWEYPMMHLTHRSPSPVCHSGHPSSVFWQHSQKHWKDEKKLHRGPENFPTEEAQCFIHKRVYLAFKCHSAWLRLKDKQSCLLRDKPYRPTYYYFRFWTFHWSIWHTQKRAPIISTRLSTYSDT